MSRPASSPSTNTRGRGSSPPPSSSPPSSPGASRMMSQKRRIEALEEENNDLKNKKKKKPITEVTLGRPICRLVSLFTSLDTLLGEHDRRCDPTEEEDSTNLADVDVDMLNLAQREEYEQRIDFKRTQDRNYEGFTLLLKHVPHLKKRIFNDQVAHLDLKAEFGELTKGARGARGEDISKGAMELADWINARNPAPKPLLIRLSRLGRGLTHDLTGQLICPIDLDWNASSVRAELRGNIKSVVKHSALPFFLPCLYRNEAGDVSDPLKGWLQGPLLVKTLVMVFKSASAVGNEVFGNPLDGSDDENINPEPHRLNNPISSKLRKSTRRNNAEIYNLTTVSPRMIAYAAVMLRFGLSGTSTWGTDRSFPYESFYNAIIDFFEDVEVGSEEEERNKKLLAWWNTAVFSGSNDGLTNDQSLQGFRNTLRNINGQRRAAKAARRANSSSSGTEIDM